MIERFSVEDLAIIALLLDHEEQERDRRESLTVRPDTSMLLRSTTGNEKLNNNEPLQLVGNDNVLLSLPLVPILPIFIMNPETLSTLSCTAGKGKETNNEQIQLVRNNEDSDHSLADEGNEIKVFCPKCNAEVSHTAEGIQEDQTKIIIAKVYHYFEQEYEELKKSFEGLELTPLSKFRQRTALATGVSETTVAEVLQEEARRQELPREDARRDESPARKRPRQADSSSDEDSDSDSDDDGVTPSSAIHEEVMVVVKEEPVEQPSDSYNEPEILVQLPEVKTEPDVSGANDAPADPIALELKLEPNDEEATTSNNTLAVKRETNSIIPRKKKRNTESPCDASAPPTPNTPPGINVPLGTNIPPGINSPPGSKIPPGINASPGTHIPRGTFAPPGTNAPPTPNTPSGTSTSPRRQLHLLDEDDIKMEQIDIEEGFS